METSRMELPLCLESNVLPSSDKSMVNRGTCPAPGVGTSFPTTQVKADTD